MITTKNTTKQYVNNVVSSWVHTVIAAFVSAINISLNLRYLGKDLYGVSVLVVSFLSLFQFLSFGMGPTLLRFFSQSVASGDLNRIRKLFSTTSFMMGVLGLVGALLFLCGFPYFISLYEISHEVKFDLFVLFLATAFNFFVGFYLLPFNSSVCAFQKFSWINYYKCFAGILRIVLLWIGYNLFRPSLVIMGLAILTESLVRLGSEYFMACALYGRLVNFKLRFLSLRLIPNIFSFGFLAFMNVAAFGLSLQVPVLIIGNTLGTAAVAAFSPAVVVSNYVSVLLGSISGPLTPLASKKAKEGKNNEISFWAVHSSSLLFYISLFFLIVFVLFGQNILAIWLDDSFAWMYLVCAIMVAGVALAATQQVNYTLALGYTTIAPSAYSSLVMCILAILGVYIGTRYLTWSLLEVAVYLMILRVLRNVCYMAYAYSKVIGYRYREYVFYVYLKPLFVGLVLALPLLSVDWKPMIGRNIALLVLCVSLLSVPYCFLVWRFGLNRNFKNFLKEKFLSVFLRG